MKIAHLPKTWLVHAITYIIKGETDIWGASQDELIDVSNVRVEATKSFSINQQQEQITANYVVFVDGLHSTPIPNFKVGNKIVWEGNEYVITRVMPFTYPDSPKLHHYELEVV